MSEIRAEKFQKFMGDVTGAPDVIETLNALDANASLGQNLATLGIGLVKSKTPKPVDKLIDKLVDELDSVTNKGLGGNPFKGKSFDEIHEILTERGFKTKGIDPVSGKGSYTHPKTDRKYYLDKGKGGYKNGMKENPHVDVHHMRDGKNLETEKRKYPLGDKLYEKE